MAEATQAVRWHVTRDLGLAPPTRPVPVRDETDAFGGAERGAGVDEEEGAEGEDEVRAAPAAVEEISFNSDEAAARFYLSQVLERDDRPAVTRLTAPDRPQVVPDLRLVETYDVPTTRTRVLRFQQFDRDIPVFGTRAVVELDADRKAKSVAAEVASVDGVSPVATLSAEAAFERLANAIGVDRKALRGVAAPRLTFFEDKAKGRWHLAFLFLDVPGRPRPRALDHGLAPSPRSAEPRTHCVVAATGTGRLLFRYGADPALSDLPVQCRGVDELDRKVVFWGRAKDGAYLLTDPQRHTETYDLGFRDLTAAPTPDAVISSTTVDWGDKHRAAISAHANGSRVLDFYNSVLFRDGIDGRSMPLVSLVNCVYRPKAQDEQHWANAVWYHDRMWYGQTEDATLGRLASYSRFLDVIAHELTHGVTASTSGLVYQGESGALNESFSDIFGVIIANWNDSREDGGDVRKWAWTIGAGLGTNGGPLRDLADPARTGMPDHMTKFRTTAADNGGVHANSNIHNKAAYGVLTAKDAHGKRVFSPLDVARIYYWCLQRLNDRATFATVLAELVDVTSSLYAGDPVALDRAVTAIKKAYAAVGISA